MSLAADAPSLDDAALLVEATDALVAAALAATRSLTAAGDRIDDHQVVVEAVTYAATEARVARALLDASRAHAAAGPAFHAAARCAIAGLHRAARDRLDPVAAELDLATALTAVRAEPIATALARLGHERQLRAVGRAAIEASGRQPWPLDPTLSEIRTSVRQFAEREIAPLAEHIHRTDELVPERIITAMAGLGYFGLSVPEAYGGHELGNLAMILTTEELSRASLAAGGSLITRPEILTKALLAGGTEAQRAAWLPRLASGELMVAIAVTEPDTGSDVASVACRAVPATDGDRPGWRLAGAKAWCTFAGRADVIAVLARTEPDSSRGARGLSLFIVDKPRFDGHSFVAEQPGGGRLVGKADRTPGYRGMHSFTLAFEDWFVPAANLVGDEAGLGRGFHLQMAGFAAGRLQTGGRACGLAQAALEQTATYVAGRRQFGQPIADFGLTQHQLGLMVTRLTAARAITYAAAQAMDEGERAAAPLAAQAKLFACDVAVEVTQRGQVLHGGWGYAEEYPISRHVVDALVLPIFEGVRPILVLKVIARALLG